MLSIISTLLYFIIYMLFCIFLYKYNKLKTGEETYYAFLPFFHVYLLGKLALNSIYGWILTVIMIFLSLNVYVFIPLDMFALINKVMSFLLAITTLYLIFKYYKLKKSL